MMQTKIPEPINCRTIKDKRYNNKGCQCVGRRQDNMEKFHKTAIKKGKENT